MARLFTIFVVLGAVIGGGFFVATRDYVMAMHSSGGEANILQSLLLLPMAIVLASFISLPLGAVPAAIGCMLYKLFLARFTTYNPRPIRRVAIGGLIGAVVCCTFGGVFFSAGTGPGSYPPWVNLSAWLVAGVSGGAISALVAGNSTYAALFQVGNRKVS